MQFLSSKMFSLQQRCYSTPKAALKLWVKHNGGPSTQVPIKDSVNIDDFAEKVKRKLNTNCQVSLFTSLEKDALRPGLEIKELLKTDALKKNSDESPLFVKLIPATQDSIATKTIYIGKTDDDGKFTGKYKRKIVGNDNDFMKVIKNADGLIHLSSPDDVLVSFEDIKDGEYYHLDNYSQDFSGWQKNEADAMEAEALLSLKAFLMNELKASPINSPNKFFDEKRQIIQEWDGILSSKDTIYLLEAKHTMTVDKVKTIAQRVEQFPKMIQQSTRKDLDLKNKKIVGVACGNLFPNDCREEAHSLGLMVIYPSGSRFGVNGKINFDFIIE